MGDPRTTRIMYLNGVVKSSETGTVVKDSLLLGLTHRLCWDRHSNRAPPSPHLKMKSLIPNTLKTQFSDGKS